MKLGKEFKIKIGGHIFTVKPVKDAEEMADLIAEYLGIETELEHGTFAITIHAKNIILLRNDIAQSQKEESFLHEIVHGVSPDLDEIIVRILAFNLYQTLKENGFLKFS